MEAINFRHFVSTWALSAIETIGNQEVINAKTLLSLREYVVIAQHCNSEAEFRPDYVPRWVLEEMLKGACIEPEKYLDVIMEIISQLSSRGE